MDSFLEKCGMYQQMLETWSSEDVKSSMLSKITDMDTFTDIINYDTPYELDCEKLQTVLELCDMFNYNDINTLIHYLSIYNISQLVKIHQSITNMIQKYIDESDIIQFRAYIFHDLGYSIKSIIISSEYDLDYKYIQSFRDLTKIKFNIDSKWILPIITQNNTIAELIISNNYVELGYLPNLKHLKKLDIRNTIYLNKLLHRLDVDTKIKLFNLANLDELHITYQLADNFTMNTPTCHIYTYEDEFEEDDNFIINVNTNVKYLTVYCKADVTFDISCSDDEEHKCDIKHIII